VKILRAGILTTLAAIAAVSAYAQDVPNGGDYIVRLGTSSSTLVERMRVTQAGHVGIGTSTPATELAVSGTVTASGVAAGGLIVTGATQLANVSATALEVSGTVSATAAVGIAVYGYGGSQGGHFETASTTGTAVYGINNGTTGSSFGVYGKSYSTTGYGVFGYALAATGASVGVLGRTDSTGGTAVYGNATTTTGTTYGVFGSTASTTGTGVYGDAPATSGLNYGVYGSSASSSGYGIYCNSARTSGCGGNRAWTNTSDARLKRDVRTLDDSQGLAAIMKLRPVTFKWRTDNSGQTDMGFIAQEVEPVLPALVGSSPDTSITTDAGTKQTVTHVKSLSYAGFVVPLVMAVQEQQAEILEQRAALRELKAANDNLRAELEVYRLSHP